MAYAEDDESLVDAEVTSMLLLLYLILNIRFAVIYCDFFSFL